jgi:hypothetical protein
MIVSTPGGPGAGAGPFRANALYQAHWCRALGSPFTAGLLELVAARLDPASPLGRLLDGWTGNATDDALALRLCGALHGRVRTGKAPALAALYPPNPAPDPDILWEALRPLLAGSVLLPWIARAPQTNEVARSGVLMPGFLTVAAGTGLPLALLELGCSAGLNLVPDLYQYRLGGMEAGAAESGLTLAPEWEGGDPPLARVVVADRAGVDLNPLDVSDPAQRQRLLAYVWPDQPERLDRMARAMAIAADTPLRIVGGDAADFVEEEAWPREGVAVTVFHSIAFQYFGAETQERISRHMGRAGEAATAKAPLAWLRFEMDPGAPDAPPTLRLRLWPDGEDRLLARAHPHGRTVHWLA